jgi:hypothetical protein
MTGTSSSGDKGISAWATIAGGASRALVTRTTVESTDRALDSQTSGVGSATVAVSYSMITNNFTPWYQQGAGSTLRTFGNNQISDNVGSVGTGTLTTVTLQ